MLTHRTHLDVRFYELDPYNHVNHTMYLAYCEVARIEALDEAGIGLPTLEQLGWRIIVVELTAKFLKPAHSGDRLDIGTEVMAVHRASAAWHQEIHRGNDEVFHLDMRAAITNLDGRPVRTPDVVREALEA